LSAAKQNPHRPGLAPALGLRAGDDRSTIPQTAVYPKGGSVMEPRQSDKPVPSRDEGLTSPRRPPERKRRFQIVKLEERIAPNYKGAGTGHTKHCGP
jgi:hypothetical protein